MVPPPLGIAVISSRFSKVSAGKEMAYPSPLKLIRLTGMVLIPIGHRIR